YLSLNSHPLTLSRTIIATTIATASHRHRHRIPQPLFAVAELLSSIAVAELLSSIVVAELATSTVFAELSTSTIAAVNPSPLKHSQPSSRPSSPGFSGRQRHCCLL
ncbi:hypothetical protein S245_052659, partial [Arachis hypogaea]